MEIRDVQGNGPPPPIRRGGRGQSQRKSQAARRGDTVEISPAARQAVWVEKLVARVRQMPEVRPGVVEAARAALASGQLDTPAAIQATVRGITQGL